MRAGLPDVAGMMVACCWLGVSSIPAIAAMQPVQRFVTEDFPPFSQGQGGQVSGPMEEILQLACARMGLHCQTQVVPWRRALQMLDRKMADGIYSVMDIPQRRAAMRISPPVLQGRYSLFGLKGTGWQYAGPASLSGLQVAAYGPSATEFALDQLLRGTDGRKVEELDNQMALGKLANHRYGQDGLVLINEQVANWLIRQNGLSNIEFKAAIQPLRYCFGLSRQWPEEDFKRFSAQLTQLCLSGETERIAVRHGLHAAPCR